MYHEDLTVFLFVLLAFVFFFTGFYQYLRPQSILRILGLATTFCSERITTLFFYLDYCCHRCSMTDGGKVYFYNSLNFYIYYLIQFLKGNLDHLKYYQEVLDHFLKTQVKLPNL